MKPNTLVLAAAVMALAGSAAADPKPVYGVRDRPATQCLDTLGIPRAPVCRTLQASRIRTEPDICICEAGLREVSVPWCALDEVSAPDSAAANRVRNVAAKAGTLMTARFEGRRFCAQQGRTGRTGP